MQQQWNARQVRQVLENWWRFDHKLAQLSYPELRCSAQLDYRLTYLTPGERNFLKDCFYHQGITLNSVTEHLKISKDQLLYRLHRLETKLGRFQSGPNSSVSNLQAIQERRLRDGFHSIFQILGLKIQHYDRLKKLNQTSPYTCSEAKNWPFRTCLAQLKRWYSGEHATDDKHVSEVESARQIETRISYLKPNLQQVLRLYFDHSKAYRLKLRSEHLAQDLEINLEDLLKRRLKAIRELTPARQFPKIEITADEKWQLANDQQDIQSIVKTLF